MTDLEWSSIHYFYKREISDPTLIEYKLMKKLEDLRKYLNKAILITSSNDPKQKHLDHSYHYQNKAADIICPELEAFDFFLAALRFDWGGIGIYDWTYDNKRTGGLHVDVRDIAPGGYSAQWLGVSGTEGITKYLPINNENMRKYHFV